MALENTFFLVSADNFMNELSLCDAGHRPKTIIAEERFLKKNFFVSDRELSLLKDGNFVLILKRKPSFLMSVSELMEVRTGLSPLVEKGAFVLLPRKEKNFQKNLLENKNIDRSLLPASDTLKVISDSELILSKPSEKTYDFTLALPKKHDIFRFLKKKGSITVLAFGAEMNSAFCILKCFRETNKGDCGNPFVLSCRATLSKDYSDTSLLENFRAFSNDISKVLRLKPDIIASDLHPRYNVSLLAEKTSEKNNIPHVRIQHHIAHAYSSLALTGEIPQEFSAIVADGLGFGEDGKIWGGEVFANGKRTGHLENHIQPGGDAATNQPWRMLLSILLRAIPEDLAVKKTASTGTSEKNILTVKRQIESGYNCVETSSCGRVLDAAACLLGLCCERTYEARPALLLESEAVKPLLNSEESFKPEKIRELLLKSNILLEPIIKVRDGMKILMTSPLFKFLVANLDMKKELLALLVHYYIAEGLSRIAKESDSPLITFSGGCAYNRILTSWLKHREVTVPPVFSPGDGGIALGQAVCALLYPMKT